MFYGGHHERDKRPGTRCPGIVGMGRAAESARALLDESAARIAAMRNRLEETILETIPRCQVNGNREKRVANTTNIMFEGAEAESLVIALDLRGVAAPRRRLLLGRGGTVARADSDWAFGGDGALDIRFSLARDCRG